LKKALDVTTKGWSQESIEKLKKAVNAKNYRWQAKVETKDGKIKFCYAYTKADVEIMAIQQGFTILKVTKL
jgi:hypothetical protein